MKLKTWGFGGVLFLFDQKTLVPDYKKRFKGFFLKKFQLKQKLKLKILQWN